MATLIQVAETLLDKRGGYLSNDRLPPGVLMDNMPNWEFGALVQIRDMAKALRNDFSRSQSQSAEDRDLTVAEPQFNFDTAQDARPPHGSRPDKKREPPPALPSLCREDPTPPAEDAPVQVLRTMPAPTVSPVAS